MIAFLEKILLDDAGKVRPQYAPDEGAHDDGLLQENGRREAAPPAQEDLHHADTSSDHHRHISGSERAEPVSHEQERSAANPLKRKLDQPLLGDWPFSLNEIDISQHLPPQPLLEKVADFFCISFHHWIPYIHKQRLQTRVRQGSRDSHLDLVLHALVAVSLRHMKPNELFMDTDEILQQTRVSRLIVETHSVRSVSVESLQALIFIVFDYVSAPTLLTRNNLTDNSLMMVKLRRPGH